MQCGQVARFTSEAQSCCAAVVLLLGNYVGAAVLAVRVPTAFHQRFMITAHAVLAALLLRAWRAVHAAE